MKTRPRASKKCWEWIPSSKDTFPVNAVPGGFLGKHEIYVARAAHEGNLTPGRFSFVYRMAFIPYNFPPEGEQEGGKEIGKFSYDILVAPPNTLKWIDYDFRSGLIPWNAVAGGYSEYFHETLYIGRWFLSSDNLLVGSVQPSHKTCYVPYNNQVIKVHNQIQILVEC